MSSVIYSIPIAIVCIISTTGCGGPIGYNVDPSKAPRKLPLDAKEVHFATNPGFRNPNSYFEFSTSRSNFLEWAKQQPNVVQTKEIGSFIVYRYSKYPGENDQSGSAVVDEGLLFDWYDPNDGDFGEHIAYDTQTGRAYFWSHQW